MMRDRSACASLRKAANEQRDIVYYHDLSILAQRPFLCTHQAPAASLNGVSDAMVLTAMVLTPPPFIPPDAPAGGWALEADFDGNPFWVWEEDVPSPRVEEALAVGDA